MFSSPVVGCFGPLILLSPANNYNIDFLTVSKEELCGFTIPLSFDVSQTAVVHGLAGWFDLHFFPSSKGSATHDAAGLTAEEIVAGTTPDLEMDTKAGNSTGDTLLNLGLTQTVDGSLQLDPSISSSYMSTSPYATPTHWQQVRFLFQEPLAINRGQKLVGELVCRVNDFR